MAQSLRLELPLRPTPAGQSLVCQVHHLSQQGNVCSVQEVGRVILKTVDASLPCLIVIRLKREGIPPLAGPADVHDRCTGRRDILPMKDKEGVTGKKVQTLTHHPLHFRLPQPTEPTEPHKIHTLPPLINTTNTAGRSPLRAAQPSRQQAEQPGTQTHDSELQTQDHRA